MQINFDVIVPKFEAVLRRGLCAGMGTRDGQMCIEAAICAALDLPHGDEPSCVSPVIRAYKIALNDKRWSSPAARAAGLRRLGILQMGTETGFDDSRFVSELRLRTVRDLLSDLLERLNPERYATHIAACRAVTTREEARAAALAASADADAYAAAAAAAPADAYAAYAAAAAAAHAAALAASAATLAASAARRTRLAGLPPDYYLLMSARIAESILVKMQTPGAQWLAKQEEQ